MRFARIGFTLAGLGVFGVLGAMGCSSATPPAQDGAYNVHFVGGGPAGCNVGGHFGTLGGVTATTHGAVVSDGTDGSTVTCSVTGGGPFSISGQILNGANSLTIRVDSLPTNATMANPAPGGVSFVSPVTVKTFSQTSSSTMPCDFYFVAGSQESVSPGKVWLAFTCAAVSDGADTCQVQESYVLLENCSE